MNNINLESKYLDFIKQILCSVFDDIEIFIFGSRTQGKADEYSDIDIAIKSKNKLDITDILYARSKFHDSTFPFKVDIIDLNNIDEKFYKIIEPDLVKIK